MDVEFGPDLIGDRGHHREIADILGFVELMEQSPHSIVVRDQQVDGIHEAP